MLDRLAKRLQAKSDKRMADYKPPGRELVEQMQPLLPELEILDACPVWTRDPTSHWGSGSIIDLAFCVDNLVRGKPKRRILVLVSDEVLICDPEQRTQSRRSSPVCVVTRHSLSALGEPSGNMNMTAQCGDQTWHVEFGDVPGIQRIYRRTQSMS